jgi:hypothetical protein
MWIEGDRFQVIDSALELGRRGDIDRLLSDIFKSGSGHGQIPTACPTCRRDLVRTALPEVGLYVSACPDRHGAWMTNDVRERLHQFVEQEVSVAARRRHLIKVANRAVVVAGLAMLAVFTLSYAVTSEWISVPSPSRTTTLDRPDWLYFQQLMKFLDEGISNRIGMELVLKTQSSPDAYAAHYTVYRKRQLDLLTRLNRLDVPDRLQPVHARIARATEQQIAFYEAFVDAKSQNPSVNLSRMLTHPALHSTDQDLRTAYGLIKHLYPNLDHATDDAIDQHLCAFDALDDADPAVVILNSKSSRP